jgi:hypothetical protein
MAVEMATYDMEMISAESKGRKYDYFILAPNIERRSRAFFKWGQNRVKCAKYILADYSNFHKNLSEEQEENYYTDFEKCTSEVFKVNDDNEFFRNLNSLSINTDCKVGVDITGFSVPTIYSLIYYLKNKCCLSSLDVYYTEPRNYVYEEGYFDSYHPNNNYRTCAPVVGYINSGRNQMEVLTIFLGFDGGLADLVYGKLGEEGKEIVKTIVVNGFPSYTAKLKDVSLFNNETLINKLDKSDRMTTTANNPFDTYNTLCKILKESGNTLLNICTIGSKPVALGACLFALDHKQEVKVTYPFYTKTKFDVLEQEGKMWRYGVIFD